jgi:hypothetical protein
VTFCCGSAETLGSIQAPVPETTSETDCDDPTALDLAQVLLVQAQVCAGGQLDLCAEPGSTTFGCVGEGAQTVVAQSRISIEPRGEQPNAHPSIDALTLSGAEWGEGILEVTGCLDEDCSNRRCEEGECPSGQTCSDGRCREEILVGLGPSATEPYLDDCDDDQSCDGESDCGRNLFCVEGRCRRLEKPLVSFFATAGLFDPGRDELDEDGDGRPDGQEAQTSWSPPILDTCAAPDDPCSFGVCDPDLGRCLGEVTFWLVARDGRGGQSWLERSVLLVP